MKYEFNEYFNELYSNGEKKLRNAIQLKNKALNSCIDQQKKQRDLQKSSKKKNKLDMKFLLDESNKKNYTFDYKEL